MSNYVDVVLNGEDVDLPCELAEDVSWRYLRQYFDNQSGYLFWERK